MHADDFATQPFCFGTCLVALDHSIPQADDARAALDHTLIMSDKHQGFPLLVEIVKETENFSA